MASRFNSGVALGVRPPARPCGRVADQLKYIFALERIAAGKHKNRHAHLRNLVDQGLALFVRQLVRMRDRLRSGTAMLACQVARLRHFPIARNGVSSKFNPPRAGMLCIGCMFIRPPRIEAGVEFVSSRGASDSSSSRTQTPRVSLRRAAKPQDAL